MPTIDQWTAVTRALDPKAELPLDEAGDILYVEVAYSPSERIVRRLRAHRRGLSAGPLDALPPKFLYCGARGSGKTTQLRRLARQLSGDWEVLLVDLAPVLPEQVTTVQLVTHMGLALLARLGQWEGADGGVARVLGQGDGRGFAAALGKLVHEADLPEVIDALAPLVFATEPAVAAGSTAVRGVVRAIRALRPGRDQIRPVERLARAEKLVRRLQDEELEEARAVAAEVSRLAEALHGRAGRPVVLLVDGLDKLADPKGVLSAFDERDLLVGLSAAVVLTAPATLSSEVGYVGLRQDLVLVDLHNAPVVGPEGERRAEGIDALVTIARRRLGPLAGLFDDEVLTEAAVWSSGIARDFLAIVGDAALLAEEEGADRVRRPHADAVAKEFRLRLQRPLTLQDLRILDRVRRSRRADGSARGQALLFQNFIAWYPNENGYFRPHELLARWVESEIDRIGRLPDPVAPPDEPE